MIGRAWTAMIAAAGVRSWAMIGAMMGMTVFAAGLVAIVWKGPWEAVHQGQQLDIIGWMAWGALLIIGLGFISLASIGVAATISKSGVSLNVGDDDHQPDAVKVTTETTVSASAVSTAEEVKA